MEGMIRVLLPRQEGKQLRERNFWCLEKIQAKLVKRYMDAGL